MRLPIRLFLLASAALVGCDGVASAQTLYGYTAYPGKLITINTATGAATVIGPFPAGVAMSGLAARGGKLYTFNRAAANKLVELDRGTGGSLGTVDVGFAPSTVGSRGGLAFRSDGIGFLREGGTNKLYRLDVAAASNSLVASGVLAGFQGLSFNSADVLHGVGYYGGGRLWTINQATAGTTLVGKTGFVSPQFNYGLAFNAAGNLYTTAHQTGQNSLLYKLDPTTGAATLIGDTGIDYVLDIAFAPPPPPASVFVTESGGSTDVVEGGATDTYTVVLSRAPTGNVTITPNPGAQVTVAPAMLTFTPGNWSVAQTVTVTAFDDALVEPSPHFGTITHSAASADLAYNGLPIVTVVANITDNDGQGVAIIETGGATNAAEGGVTDSYDVVLIKAPLGNVTVTVNAGTQLSVFPSTLTFTPGNWSVRQTVTVAAVDDALVEGQHVGMITHSAVSTDPAYNGIAIPSVTADITDNDFDPPPPLEPGGEGNYSGAHGVPGSKEGCFGFGGGQAPTNRTPILQSPVWDPSGSANYRVVNLSSGQRIALADPDSSPGFLGGSILLVGALAVCGLRVIKRAVHSPNA